MTGPSAVEQPNDADNDTEQTRLLRTQMVDSLVRDGALTDERWTSAFLQVPRHVLVPAFYESDDTRMCGETNRDVWLGQVYSNTTLVTQRQRGAPTSSGTMPSLVATMLEALDVQDCDRALQVATGTGYTAALLCERLTSDNVTSIDVDPDLTAAAWERLYRCGYHPTIITGDGRFGYHANAPYDRCVVTFGVDRVPDTWIEQTRTGGVIVAPVHTGLARLTVTGPDRAEGRFIGAGYFIRHHETALPADNHRPVPLAEEHVAGADQRASERRLLRHRFPVYPRVYLPRPSPRVPQRQPTRLDPHRAGQVACAHHPGRPCHPNRATPGLG